MGARGWAGPAWLLPSRTPRPARPPPRDTGLPAARPVLAPRASRPRKQGHLPTTMRMATALAMLPLMATGLGTTVLRRSSKPEHAPPRPP